MELAIDGDIDGDFSNITEDPTSPQAVRALIEHLDMKLTGGRLSSSQFDALYNNLKDVEIYQKDDPHNKKYRALTYIIHPAIRAIVTNSIYMTE